MVGNSDKENFSELRKRARAFLATRSHKTDFSHQDLQKLVHELDTHQIELELQNEELRNTQQELEKSRSKYADLYDFAPAGYITLNDKGLILEANFTACDMLGIAKGQLLNRPCTDFIVSTAQDSYYLGLKKILETKQPQSVELELKRLDGTTFHAQIEVAFCQEDGPTSIRIRAILTDISVKKGLELAKVRRLKNRYRAIVMDQNDLICRYNPEGKITFVNDAYCRYFEVNYKQVLGTNFLPEIHKDDLHLINDPSATGPLLPHGQKVEFRVCLPNGKFSWQQWCATTIRDHEGNVLEHQIVGRDITQLKETEQKLKNELRLRQTFLDALPCIAILVHYDTREIIASNKTAAETGVVPGQKCHIAFAQRESPCSCCRAHNSMVHDGIQNTQYWKSGKCWDSYWVRVDENSYLHYLFDISEKEENKEALKKANRELERRVAERTLELQTSHRQLLHAEKLAAVGHLSASIAHEFNSPLQSVLTIIDGLGKYASLETKDHELIDVAVQECKRMKKLIASLSDFFQPTSGRAVFVDIHKALDSILLLSKKDFETRDIEIVRNYDPSLPYIMGVTDQLKQVFINLLSNAADACNKDGMVTITTENIGANDIVIHIEDNGTGIEEANKDRIFEPFFTTKPEMKGIGLGLAISYGIVKKHGGRIEVKSEAGEGARFSLFLPVEGTVYE